MQDIKLCLHAKVEEMEELLRMGFRKDWERKFRTEILWHALDSGNREPKKGMVQLHSLLV